MEGSMLEVKNISKSFGKIVALDDVSFDVREGEFVFIMGPSGAGKTTLMRLILRDILPDAGEILLSGHDITKLKEGNVPKLRQRIGVVFQDFKILPERTLQENIEVALAVSGIDSSEWDDRLKEVLKLVGLVGRKNLFPSQLSGGEIQRAAIARALVVNPKIILADEPTGNLDWDTADEIMGLLEKINDEGKTVLMATHHQLIVDKMDKRLIKLKKGKLESDSESKRKKSDIKSQTGESEKDSDEKREKSGENSGSDVKGDKENKD